MVNTSVSALRCSPGAPAPRRGVGVAGGGLLDTVTAWVLVIAGFTDTAYARRVARRFHAGPIAAVHFDQGELTGRPFAEFFVRACAPAAALAAVAAARPPARHYLTVLENRPGLRAAYEGAGYHFDDAETLMAGDLAAISLPAAAWPVAQVQSAEAAAWHNANDPQGIPWALPDNVADPRMAHHAILRDGQLVARGRNLRLDANHSYVSRVYTAETHRGQGLARALMVRILADDRARGARWSVLTASRMGERLYRGLGYQDLGTILIFEANENTAPTPQEEPHA